MKGHHSSSAIVDGAGNACPGLSVHTHCRQVEIQVQVEVDVEHGNADGAKGSQMGNLGRVCRSFSYSS